MTIKKYDLKLAVLRRFLRAWIPQLVVYLPVLIAYADKIKEFLPLWVIPVLGFVAAVITSLDKLIRELRK